MYVSIDDTDSLDGNCTTFLITEIIDEFRDLDLIGYPRLVRLNPAVPWKTRGNGSLSIELGKGIGAKRHIGMIAGRDIFCFEEMAETDIDEMEILKRIIPLVERYHEDSADPGVIVSKRRPSDSFYWSGVRTIVDINEVRAEIERINAKTFGIGCERGLIGALCGMAWEPGDSTLELLTYRKKEKWGTEREYDPLSIREADMSTCLTFNSWEERTRKVTMVPSTPCPVMYGFRGEDEWELLYGLETIKTEPLDRWMIFLTNQGTDDHIILDAEEMVLESSYYVEGKVRSSARHEKGGHVFFDIDSKYGCITVGVYEPSKDFRHVPEELSPGDVIGVMGEMRKDPRTLNAEKIKVISVVDRIEKISNPICEKCSRTMGSAGKDKGYRCRDCHTSSSEPVVKRAPSYLIPGWYEPPESSRRHLSKPLKRMGEEQPVMFVNSRMQ